jgi:CheY-like chemotaxis protein
VIIPFFLGPLLAQTRQTPIILLSATPQDIVMKGIRMDSYTYFLAKPYKKDQFLELVRQIFQENTGASGS